MIFKGLAWGILGAGRIAEKFVQSLRASQGGGEILAVGSATPGKAESFAAKYDVKNFFDDYETLLAREEVNAVYVANTHNFHHETVLAALDAGKHVLCEKPLAVNAGQVREMMDAARSADRFLMEGMWTRFLPACRQLVDWIRAGRIGEILQIEASLGCRGNWPKSGRMYNPDLAGGALLDMGIYPLSFASLVMRGSKPIRIRSSACFADTGVDEDAVLVFEYEDSIKAILRTSFRVPLESRALVIGAEGTGILPASFFGQTEVRLVGLDRDEEKCFSMAPEEGFRFEIEHMADCIQRGVLDSPIMPLGETLALAETMDEIRRKWGLVYPGES